MAAGGYADGSPMTQGTCGSTSATTRQNGSRELRPINSLMPSRLCVLVGFLTQLFSKPSTISKGKTDFGLTCILPLIPTRYPYGSK